MADQTADSRTITGKIIEAMIPQGILGSGSTEERAQRAAAAFKTVYAAVSEPTVP